MPGCVLRIAGSRDAVTEAVTASSIDFIESRASARVFSPVATFLHTVSDEDGDHVPAQIDDAQTFVATHRAELARILSLPGVEGGCLDFGWEIGRDRIAQFNRWPHALLGACAAIGLDLDVSVYLRGHESGAEQP